MAIGQLAPPPRYEDIFPETPPHEGIFPETPPPSYESIAPQIDPLPVSMPAGASETASSMPAATAGGSRVGPSAASTSRHTGEAAIEEHATVSPIEEALETGCELVIQL